MWNLIKAELSYRSWMTIVVLFLVMFIPIMNVVFKEPTKSTITLSYISWPLGLFFFLWIVILQSRNEQEKRVVMLARLPLSAFQRQIVRFSPLFIFAILLMILNLVAWIFLGKQRSEYRPWIFMSSALIWCTLNFLWVGIRDFIQGALFKHGRATVFSRIVVVFLWIITILTIFMFPFWFNNLIDKFVFTCIALGFALISISSVIYLSYRNRNLLS